MKCLLMRLLQVLKDEMDLLWKSFCFMRYLPFDEAVTMSSRKLHHIIFLGCVQVSCACNFLNFVFLFAFPPFCILAA